MVRSLLFTGVENCSFSHPRERAVLVMLSTRSIGKFKEIYQREFGVDLSQEEAAEQAQRLLNLVRVVMQPMPKRYEARYKELLVNQKKTTSSS